MERLRAKEGGFEEEYGGSERNLEGEKKKRRNSVGEGNGKEENRTEEGTEEREKSLERERI